MQLLVLASLIPTIQFLIACSMQKQRGRPGPFYHMNDVSVYLGRQRGGEGFPIERTSLRPYLVVSAPSTGVSNVCEVKNVPLLVQNEERVREMHSFDRGPLPASVYLGRHRHHSRDKMDQA